MKEPQLYEDVEEDDTIKCLNWKINVIMLEPEWWKACEGLNDSHENAIMNVGLIYLLFFSMFLLIVNFFFDIE